MTALDNASRAFMAAADQLDTLYRMDEHARQLVSLADAVEDNDLTEEERSELTAEIERVLQQMLVKVEHSAGFIIDMEKRAKAAEEEEHRLRRLKQRRQRLADRVREGLYAHMKDTGEPIIDTPRFTLALRLNNPKVEVVDEHAVPDEYWRPETKPPDSNPEARSCGECGALLVVSKSEVMTHWRATGGKSIPSGVVHGDRPPGTDVVRGERLDIR